MGSAAELDLSDTAIQQSAGGRMPILRVNHLSVFFSKGSSLFARGEGVTAVNDVSFVLFPSEIFCLARVRRPLADVSRVSLLRPLVPYNTVTKNSESSEERSCTIIAGMSR
jgi:hypothetical protein